MSSVTVNADMCERDVAVLQLKHPVSGSSGERSIENSQLNYRETNLTYLKRIPDETLSVSSE